MEPPTVDPPQPEEACGRCDGPLGWIDEAWVCSAACTYCVDCKDELGGVCANCSESLMKRKPRIQPIRRSARESVSSGSPPLNQPQPPEPFK